MKEFIELSPNEKAHLWQSHRILCIELAIKSGAGADWKKVAEQISDHIMDQSAREKGAA